MSLTLKLTFCMAYTKIDINQMTEKQNWAQKIQKSRSGDRRKASLARFALPDISHNPPCRNCKYTIVTQVLLDSRNSYWNLKNILLASVSITKNDLH